MHLDDHASSSKIVELDSTINDIIHDFDQVYDRVTKLNTRRREPIRSLIAAAGMILAQDRTDPDKELDRTSVQLIVIALHELGFELKT